MMEGMPWGPGVYSGYVSHPPSISVGVCSQQYWEISAVWLHDLR
jgi:hypothetical protein